MKFFLILLGITFSATALALPDLTINNKNMTSSCKAFQIVVSNRGSGVPLSAYNDERNSIRISFTGGRLPYEKEYLFPLSKFDLRKALTKRGGRVTKGVGFDTEGKVYVSSYVDMRNSVKEKNEKNNAHGKTFTCGSRPTPPGEPKIRLTALKVLPKCNILTRLKNVGPGYLGNRSWAKRGDPFRIYFRAAWNGRNQRSVFLYELDPQKKLKYPGGEVQFIFDHTKFRSDYRQGEQIEFRFATVYNGNYKFDFKRYLSCKNTVVPAKRGKGNKTKTPDRPVIKRGQ